MRRRNRKRKLTGRQIAVLIAVDSFVMIAVVAFVMTKADRQYDADFDTTVAVPAYASNGPVVLFDEGHENTHAAKGGYRPFAELVRNDGYELRIWKGSFAPQSLEGVAVLVVAASRGSNDANDDPAFTSSELDVVDQWVRGGGSLLLISDHWPYGAAAASLAERFGIRMGKGLVEDPQYHDPERGESHLVFSADNRLLGDHPIIRGRSSSERIQRVLTFTGQSLLGPPSAVSFLTLSGSATERPPTAPQVDKSGGDVRVTMEYGDPIPVSGSSQGLALEQGQGRIVVLGEAGMLRAQRENNDTLVGMNVPGYDNRQLALNIMHWLSRA